MSPHQLPSVPSCKRRRLALSVLKLLRRVRAKLALLPPNRSSNAVLVATGSRPSPAERTAAAAAAAAAAAVNFRIKRNGVWMDPAETPTPATYLSPTMPGHIPASQDEYTAWLKQRHEERLQEMWMQLWRLAEAEGTLPHFCRRDQEPQNNGGGGGEPMESSLSRAVTLTMDVAPSYSAASAASAAEIVIMGGNDPELVERLRRIDKKEFAGRKNSRRNRGPFCGGKWPKRSWPVIALFIVIIIPPAAVMGCWELAKIGAKKLKSARFSV